MSSYVHACKGFSDDEMRTIDARFDVWTLSLPHMRRIVRNIKKLEYFLHPDRLHQILASLLAARDTAAEDISKVYFAACIRHACEGGKVTCRPLPPAVSRAVESDTFFNWFCQKYRTFYPNEALARKELNEILSGRPRSATENSLPMSEHAAWVTWTPKDSRDDPIETMTSALLIRACLGLDPEARNASEPILLLIYATPSALLKPTIADAELHYQFEPPPKKERKYGQTRPLRKGLARRPEAIHQAAPLSLFRSSRTVMP
jgi:hypothetical protein